MTGLQIAMIVIGMVCLIGSFFVSEKLSKADLEEMKKMSEQEIKVILDARMQTLRHRSMKRSRIRSRMPWHRSSVAEKRRPMKRS